MMMMMMMMMMMAVNMLPKTQPKEPGPITLRNLNAQRPCLKKTPSSKGPCLAVSLKEPCRPLPILFRGQAIRNPPSSELKEQKENTQVKVDLPKAGGFTLV